MRGSRRHKKSAVVRMGSAVVADPQISRLLFSIAISFTGSSSRGRISLVDYYSEYNMWVDYPKVSCAVANTTTCLRTTVVLMQGGSHVGPVLVTKCTASALADSQGSVSSGIKRAVVTELKMKAPSVQVT